VASPSESKQSSRVAFADESGTDASTRCYAIGVVSVAAENLQPFNDEFERLKKQHGVSNEVKWTSVRNGHGLINLGIHLLHRILRSSTARFDVIVVNTKQYRKWRERGADRETAFYLTYTFLLRHLARQTRVTNEVFIDDRSDEYAKQHEVVETVANRMLNSLQSTGRLNGVTKVPSHEHAGIQVADMLTGAIAASHRLFLDPDLPIHKGKRLAIARMASLLGWDALHYDTFPDDKFNIWHFPEEYRAMPQSRQVAIAEHTPFITAADLGLE
jgi:Protein of unknown function (DUF3800)